LKVERAARIPAGLALIWGAGCVAGYYVFHKPISQAGMVQLLYLVLTLLAWMGTVANANAIGRRLIPSIQHLSPRALTALRVGMGLFVISLFMLAFGFAGLYWRWLAWLLLLVPLPWTAPALWRDLARCGSLWQGAHTKALAYFVAFSLALTLFLALLPPTAWDSLVYHLTGPQLYLRAGRIHHNVDLPYLGFPQAGSMLFLWGMLLVGPQVAQLMHVLFVLLTLMLLPELVQRTAPGRSWLAAAMLLAVPTAWTLASWAYVEWITMYAGLAAIILLVHAGEAEDGKQRLLAVLAGVFTALAFSSKYTSVGMIVGLVLAAWYITKSPRVLLIYLGGAVAASTPFLLKNLILTGNPVYPFFLAGRFWDAARASWYSRFGTGLDAGSLLLAPLHASLTGVEGGTVQGFPAYGADIGPLFLALIPMLLLRREGDARGRTTLIAIGLTAGSAYLIWLLQLGASSLLVQTRLLLPVFPLLAVLATAGFDALARWPGWGASAAFVFSGMIAMVLGLTAYAYGRAFIRARPLAMFFGEESQTDYRLRTLGGYLIAMEEMNLLPDDAVVRFLWEPRSYDCREGIVCEPDAILDRWWHARQSGMDAEELRTAWRQAGVTHVLLYNDGMEAARAQGFDPFEEADWQALDVFLSQELILVWDELDGYTLYALGGGE